jgi:hypothetical protein
MLIVLLVVGIWYFGWSGSSESESVTFPALKTYSVTVDYRLGFRGLLKSAGLSAGENNLYEKYFPIPEEKVGVVEDVELAFFIDERITTLKGGNFPFGYRHATMFEMFVFMEKHASDIPQGKTLIAAGTSYWVCKGRKCFDSSTFYPLFYKMERNGNRIANVIESSQSIPLFNAAYLLAKK